MPMHTTMAPRGLANLCRCEFNLVPLLEVTESVNSCTSAATRNASQHPSPNKKGATSRGPSRGLLCSKETHRRQTRRWRGSCARTRGRCARTRGGPARRSPSSRARPSHSSACAVSPPTPARPRALLRLFPHHHPQSHRCEHRCHLPLERGSCEQYATPTTQSPLGHRSTSRQLSVSSSTTPPSSAAKRTSHSLAPCHLHLHLRPHHHHHYSSQLPAPRQNRLASATETPNAIKTPGPGPSESRDTAAVSPDPDARQEMRTMGWHRSSTFGLRGLRLRLRFVCKVRDKAAYARRP